MAQEAHKDSVHVEQSSINKHILGGFDLNNVINQGWSPRDLQLPKINMRTFDGKDPITWIFQMEQLLDIHKVSNLQKVTTTSFYLDPQRFVWYQCLCVCKKNSIISWFIFREELISHHNDVKSTFFFTQLINLWKKSSIIKHIQHF